MQIPDTVEVRTRKMSLISFLKNQLITNITSVKKDNIAASRTGIQLSSDCSVLYISFLLLVSFPAINGLLKEMNPILQ